MVGQASNSVVCFMSLRNCRYTPNRVDVLASSFNQVRCQLHHPEMISARSETGDFVVGQIVIVALS